MRLATVAAVLVVIAGTLHAQEDQLATVERLLNVITVNAQALQDPGISIDTLQRQSNETLNYVSQLPFYAAGTPGIEGLLVEINQTAATLMGHAMAQDVAQSARDAKELADLAEQLRYRLGLPPP
jgi:hypothetical protein